MNKKNNSEINHCFQYLLCCAVLINPAPIKYKKIIVTNITNLIFMVKYQVINCVNSQYRNLINTQLSTIVKVQTNIGQKTWQKVNWNPLYSINIYQSGPLKRKTKIIWLFFKLCDQLKNHYLCTLVSSGHPEHDSVCLFIHTK